MRALAFALAAALTGCASAPDAGLIDRVFAESGAYDNAAQYAAAPEALKRPPAAGRPYDWLDRQHALFLPVEAPFLDGRALYLEWRSGGPEGPISRQRLWRFRETAPGPAMDFFTFRDPTPFADQGTRAERMRAVTEADLIGYGAACALPLRREADAVVAEIPPTCIVTARQSGRTMRIEARVEWRPGRIGYREAGVLPDGGYAFLVPGGEELAYDFRRAR
jgi:hypothetical protein